MTPVMTFASRIALGTAQFGSDYGINNTRGQVPLEDVRRILLLCAERGIRTLDTASAYGASEDVLAQICREESLRFEIVSKLPPCAPADVERLLSASSTKLGPFGLDAFLVHSFDNWAEHPTIWSELTRLKDAGRIARIGFSLYHPWQLDRLREHGIVPDLVQVPFNVFDRRFEATFDALKAQHTEIHVRSVFLQGLFFVAREHLRPHFAGVREKLDALRRIARDADVPLAAALLAFVHHDARIDRIVLGVDSPKNLEENLATAELLERAHRIRPALAELRETDEQILLPMNWR